MSLSRGSSINNGRWSEPRDLIGVQDAVSKKNNDWEISRGRLWIRIKRYFCLGVVL